MSSDKSSRRAGPIPSLTASARHRPGGPEKTPGAPILIHGALDGENQLRSARGFVERRVSNAALPFRLHFGQCRATGLARAGEKNDPGAGKVIANSLLGEAGNMTMGHS